MSKPMPPIWWYKSLQKLILDKKKPIKIKKCFCKLFFSSSPFLQSTDTMKKERKNNYQQRLKKTEKTKLERILIQIKKWKQKKIVVLEVGKRRKKKIDKMAVTFVNLTKVTELTDKLKQLKKQWAWNRHS
jgi:hypothetical protein